jgi:hypothetical protein
MKQTKRTHISIKTRDVLIIRNGLAPPEIHCPNCGVEMEILTPDQAANRGLKLLKQAEPEITAYTEDENLSNDLRTREKK